MRATQFVPISASAVLAGVPSGASEGELRRAGEEPLCYLLPSGRRYALGGKKLVHRLADVICRTLPPMCLHAGVYPVVQPAIVWNLKRFTDGSTDERAMMAFDLDCAPGVQELAELPDLHKLKSIIVRWLNKHTMFEVPGDEPMIMWLGQFRDKPISMHVYCPRLTIDPRGIDAMSKGSGVWAEFDREVKEMGMTIDGSIYRSGLKLPFMDKCKNQEWRQEVQKLVMWPFEDEPSVRDALVACCVAVEPGDEWYDRTVWVTAEEDQEPAPQKRLRSEDGRAVRLVRVEGGGNDWLARLKTAVPEWSTCQFRVKTSNWQGNDTQLVLPSSSWCPMKRDHHGHVQCYILVFADNSMMVKCQGDSCDSLSIPSEKLLVEIDEKEDVLQHYNKRYAVGPDNVDGPTFKTVVWDLLEGRFMAMKDFELLHAHDRHVVPNRLHPDKYVMVAGTKMWLHSKHRREIRGVVCDPGGVEPGFVNSYRGFSERVTKAAEQLPDDEDLPSVFPYWWAHLRTNICGDNETHMGYVLDWCAWLFQKPAEKPRVALLLSGEQGEGKNSFFGPLCSILGQQLYVQVSDSRQIGARFNHNLLGKRLVVFDEARAKTEEHMGVVKALITESVMEYEAKYAPRVTQNSFCAVILATNHLDGYSAGPTERRVFALDVRYRHEEDRDTFFKSLNAERDSVTCLAALYKFLMRRDISEFIPHNHPRTLALWRQKYGALKPEVKWWFEVLKRGYLLLERRTGVGGVSFQLDEQREGLDETVELCPFGRNVPTGKFVSSCRASCGESISDARVVRAMKTGLENMSRSRGEGNRWGYLLPSLKKCREAFAKAMQQDVDIFERDAEHQFHAEEHSQTVVSAFDELML